MRLRPVICIVLSGQLLVACSQGDSQPKPTGKKRVVDYFGREVVIPDQVDRVIPIFNVHAEYLTILGAADKIIGVGRIHRHNAIFRRLFPGIEALPKVGANNLDLERLAHLDPDVVFCGHSRPMIESIERMNIVAVGTFPSDLDGILRQLRTTGIIVGKEGEADAIINFFRSRLTHIERITERIPVADRPRVYYARYGPFETLGEGIFSEIVDAAGGRNVVRGVGGGEHPAIVSLENVYQWNPEVIIIRDNSPLSVNALLRDPKWSEVQAIKDKRVYKEHAGWSEFRIESFFGVMEKAKWFHPGPFKELRPEAEYRAFLDLVESFLP